MDKYLLPWSELLEPYDSSNAWQDYNDFLFKNNVKIFYTRRFLVDSNVNVCASQVWRLLDVWRGSFHYEDSPTKEDAMRKEDEYLIKNGFILLTEKQAERLIVLI